MAEPEIRRRLAPLATRVRRALRSCRHAKPCTRRVIRCAAPCTIRVPVRISIVVAALPAWRVIATVTCASRPSSRARTLARSAERSATRVGSAWTAVTALTARNVIRIPTNARLAPTRAVGIWGSSAALRGSAVVATCNPRTAGIARRAACATRATTAASQHLLRPAARACRKPRRTCVRLKMPSAATFRTAAVTRSSAAIAPSGSRAARTASPTVAGRRRPRGSAWSSNVSAG